MIPAVVMAGGEGTRLRPLTTSLPKPLLPVLNRPMLEHVLRHLRRHGVTDAVITVQFLASLVRTYTGDGSDLGMTLSYALEEAPLGTAGSVKNAEPLLPSSTFLVISGDAVTDLDLTAMVAQHRESGADLTVGLARVSDPIEYGGVVLDELGRLTRLVEKPSWGAVVSDLVNTGIYVVEPQVLADLPARTRLDWSADVIPALLRRGAMVDGYVSQAYWEDVGTLGRYRSVHADALAGKVHLDPAGFEVADRVWVSAGADVSPEATVAGGVLIGRNARVEPGAVIRGPSVIGDNTVVRAGAVLQRCVLHENVYVGEGCALHGAVVGRNVELMRSVRLDDGAVVGNDCVLEEESVLGTGVRVFPAKTVEAGAVLRTSVIWESRGRRSLFGVRGVSGILNVEITPELVVRLTTAFASALPKGSTVVTARDVSRGARSLKRAVTGALTAAGVDVRDLELTPLPVARSATAVAAQAGIVVRTTPGEPESMDVLLLDADGVDIDDEMRQVVDRGYVREEFRRAFPGEIGELIFPPRVISDYVAHVTRAVDASAVSSSGLRVVVDAGCGAAGLVLPSLVGALSIDAYVTNTGIDENHPTDTGSDEQKALDRLGELVISSGAAFGVRLDRMGERISLVDDRGRRVDDDRALLILLDLVASAHGGGAVAVPVSATRIAEQVAAFHGTRVHRTRVGSGPFAVRAGVADLLLAGDSEGRFAIPAVGPSADGIAAFALVTSLVARTRLTLGEIDARIPPSTLRRADIRTPWAAKGTVMREVSALARRRPGATVDTTDGVKVIERDGSWCLVLPDSTEALMRVWAEADDATASADLLAFWSDVVARAGG